jgi:proline racemase
MRLDKLITAVDAHGGGNPARVVIGGVLDVPGKSMFEKMVQIRDHGDELRMRMLREPRGYPASCCNVILPATDPTADAGFVIMLQTSYPAMSGSNVISVATVLLETGMLSATEPLTELVLEVPGGLIKVLAEVDGGKVTAVTFENVPSFAAHLNAPLEVPGIGTVVVDVAWGGVFCVIADGPALGLRVTPDEGRDIVRIGEMVKAAANEQLSVTHPENPDFNEITGTVFGAPPTRPDAAAKNATVISLGPFDWADSSTWHGVLDRSPCGTGTSARMAALHAKGQLALGDAYVHEGILGTTFTGRLIRATPLGPYSAVVPTITGQAWITGFAQYVLDPTDPFPDGFTLADIWGPGYKQTPPPGPISRP